MKRRAFITLLGAAAAWPLAVRAQQISKTPTVGILWHAGSIEEEAIYLREIQQGLQALGYVEGRNINLANTFANEEYERFNANAIDLVRRKVDILVAVTLPAALAAQRATKTIPIVFVLVPDPVATKLVDSLAHPGGNITGLSQLALDLLPKRLELFKETVTHLSRIALLLNPSDPVNRTQCRAGPIGSRAVRHFHSADRSREAGSDRAGIFIHPGGGAGSDGAA
jgi:putative tryptophan/tyrosine transport system substrate-binding protein